MNASQWPIKLYDLLYLIGLPKSARWLVRIQIIKLIRAGLVIKVKDDRYWLQYHIIVLSSKQWENYLNEEIKNIKRMVEELQQLKSKAQKSPRVDDLEPITHIFLKIIDALHNIKRNMPDEPPKEIDYAIAGVNSLISLYTEYHVLEDFWLKENTLFQRLEICLNVLFSKLAANLLAKGGPDD